MAVVTLLKYRELKYTTKTRVRSTTAQLSILTEYMAAHPRLANFEFYGPQGKAQKDRQWEELRTTLKEYGPDKSIEQWEHTWRDLKRNARNVRARANSAQRVTDIMANVPGLSSHILKILKTIGPQRPEETGVGFETDPLEMDSNDERSPPPVHEESLPAEDPVKDEETDSARSELAEERQNRHREAEALDLIDGELAEERQNRHREAEALDLIDGDPTEERRHGRVAMEIEEDSVSEPTLRYYEVRGNTVRETRSGRRATRRPPAQPAVVQENTLREAEALDSIDGVSEPTVRYYEVRGNTLRETGSGRRATTRPPAHRQNSAGPILRARRLYADQRIQIEERRMQIEERRLQLEERMARSGERIADALEAILHCL